MNGISRRGYNQYYRLEIKFLVGSFVLVLEDLLSKVKFKKLQRSVMSDKKVAEF